MARVAIAYVEVRPDMGGFGEKLRAELARYNETLDVTANVKVDDDQAGKAIRSVSKLVANEAKKASAKVKVDVDTSGLDRAAKKMRGFGSLFGGGTFGRLINATLVAASGSMLLFGRTAEKTFTAITDRVGDMIGGFGNLGKTVGDGLSQVSGMGSAVGGLAGAAGAAGVAVSLLGVAVAGANLVLGTALSIVIPLVAGITALVSELAALGGVAVGSLGIIPAALGAIAAAFAPLMLVGEKFADLFKKTSDAVGPLYVAVERLRNAIFAVVSSGFVSMFNQFATTTLPLLFGSIELVSRAWNTLLLTMLRLASTRPVLEGINSLLNAGAGLVDFFTRMLVTAGPALLQMATAGLPALGMLLSTITEIGEMFAAWVTQMTASGQMQVFFAQIALTVGQLLSMLPALANFVSGFVTAILPAASQFVTILSGIVQRWGQFLASAGGTALIQSFFDSMNRIVLQLLPVLEQVFVIFLQFGPTLSNLTATAVPALQSLLTVFMTLVNSVAPGLMSFLGQFNTMLADPAVQAAVTQLGQAIGLLISNLGQLGGHTMVQLLGVMSNFITMIAAVLEVLMPLIDAAFTFENAISSLLVPVIQVLAGVLNVAAIALRDFVTFVVDGIKKIPGLTAVADGAGKMFGWLAKQMGITGKDAVTMANNTVVAGNKMNESLSTVASSQSWDAIKTNTEATADYFVSMANNGIRGNQQLINSMAQLAASAYATKNEANQLQFEKMVGRAYTTPTPNLYRADVAVTGFAKSLAKVGSTAGTEFMKGFNAAVDTSLSGATKTTSGGTKAKKTVAGKLSTLVPTARELSAFTVIKGRSLYDTGREMALFIAKGLTSGSKNVARVASYIQKTYSSALSSMVAKNKTFWSTQKRIAKAIPDLTKKMTSPTAMENYLASRQQFYTDLLNQIVSFKDKVVDTLTSGANLVGTFGFIPTPAEVKRQLDVQLQQMRTFTANVKKLQAAGIDKNLAAQWLQAGPEQVGNLVQGLADASKTEIAAINKTYQTINKEAASTADAQATKYFGIGQSTVEGYIKGIQSMRNIANKEMQALIDSVYKAAKKKLGIKSPSTVFDDIGVDTMAGYIQGMSSMTTDTIGAVNDMFTAVATVPPATLATPRYATPATMAPPTGEPAPINVRVYLGTREITDIVRVEVDNYDTTRARTLLQGRRLG